LIANKHCLLLEESSTAIISGRGRTGVDQHPLLVAFQEDHQDLPEEGNGVDSSSPPTLHVNAERPPTANVEGYSRNRRQRIATFRICPKLKLIQ
jgi:hypothetical protein